MYDEGDDDYARREYDVPPYFNPAYSFYSYSEHPWKQARRMRMNPCALVLIFQVVSIGTNAVGYWDVIVRFRVVVRVIVRVRVGVGVIVGFL